MIGRGRRLRVGRRSVLRAPPVGRPVAGRAGGRVSPGTSARGPLPRPRPPPVRNRPTPVRNRPSPERLSRQRHFSDSSNQAKRPTESACSLSPTMTTKSRPESVRRHPTAPCTNPTGMASNRLATLTKGPSRRAPGAGGGRRAAPSYARLSRSALPGWAAVMVPSSDSSACLERSRKSVWRRRHLCARSISARGLNARRGD